jgi:ubiquinone biosynthesis protein Coq4
MQDVNFWLISQRGIKFLVIMKKFLPRRTSEQRDITSIKDLQDFLRDLCALAVPTVWFGLVRVRRSSK